MKELARVKKNLQEEEFIIDRVIKNRGKVKIKAASKLIIRANSILGSLFRV